MSEKKELSNDDKNLIKELLHEQGIKNTDETDFNHVEELINSNTLKGASDFHNLSLSIGIEVPKVLFTEYIKQSNVSDKRKLHFSKQISKQFKITEMGAISINFIDKKTKEPGIAYMVLKKCDKNYDFNSQIEKLGSRALISDYNCLNPQIHKIMELGHYTYGVMVEKCKSTLNEIIKKIDSETTIVLDELKLNLKNNTFHLDFPNSVCVGIHIEFDSEMEETH